MEQYPKWNEVLDDQQPGQPCQDSLQNSLQADPVQQVLQPGEAGAIHALFMKLMFEIWDVYSDCARVFGITDNELFILLDIEENISRPISQAQIARNLCLPVQTVNSALVKLKQKGWIDLVPLEGSRKTKAVIFSEKGKAECLPMLEKIHHGEVASITEFSKEEASRLILLLQNYIRLFRSSMARHL